MTENPAARLEVAFRAVYAERMQGLPFINPALSVEAVDILPWNGHWLGVLITPWFMNLLLLPDDDEAWPALRPGEKCEQSFPAGVFEFIAGQEDTLGDYLACSLFSPMFEFDDQETARLTASAARAALFDANNLEQTDIALHARLPEEADEAVPESGAPGSLQVLQEALSTSITRREFLQGSFLPVNRDNGG